MAARCSPWTCRRGLSEGTGRAGHGGLTAHAGRRCRTRSPTLRKTPISSSTRSRKLRLLIPLIVAFAFLMEQLDSTIVTTAIPDMAHSLQVPPLQLNLAITSYILSLAVFIPVSGWIADRFGARRVFAAALLIFTVASALLRARATRCRC